MNLGHFFVKLQVIQKYIYRGFQDTRIMSGIADERVEIGKEHSFCKELKETVLNFMCQQPVLIRQRPLTDFIKFIMVSG